MKLVAVFLFVLLHAVVSFHGVNYKMSSVVMANLDQNINHIVAIEGMKCMGCVARVKNSLKSIDPLVEVTLNPPQATFSIPVQMHAINQALAPIGSYKGTLLTPLPPNAPAPVVTIRTFIPLLVILAGISLTTVLMQWEQTRFDLATAMRYFMGNYLIVFGFFKASNLSSFATAYATYDLLAARSRAYGLLYPFLELTLGFMYLQNISPLAVQVFTLVLMSFSSAGVLQALRVGRKITCACLGTYFNLPMTYVSLLEDLLMAVMAAHGIINFLRK